jgi:hypothetical protein
MHFFPPFSQGACTRNHTHTPHTHTQHTHARTHTTHAHTRTTHTHSLSLSLSLTHMHKHTQVMHAQDVLSKPAAPKMFGPRKIDTAILTIIEGQFQFFQRLSRSKLLLKTIEDRFTALNYYENGRVSHKYILFLLVVEPGLPIDGCPC